MYGLGHTFDRLGSKEVVNSQLNAFRGIPNLLDDVRLILKDQTAGELGVIGPELEQIMTEATTHIDKKRRFGIQPLANSIHHGVEAFVTPAALSLAISAHVVIELFSVSWVLGEPDEERVLRFVCELEGTVSDVSRVSVLGCLQVSRDGVKRRSGNIEASGNGSVRRVTILRRGMHTDSLSHRETWERSRRSRLV